MVEKRYIISKDSYIDLLQTSVDAHKIQIDELRSFLNRLLPVVDTKISRKIKAFLKKTDPALNTAKFKKKLTPEMFEEFNKNHDIKEVEVEVNA